MLLRAATMADARRLWRWRNDPETRKNSLNEDAVPWEGHVRWLAGALTNPDIRLLVAEESGTPVGTLRINHGEEMSWTVAPEARGCGTGKDMVRQAAFPGASAQIKASNFASQKVALNAGFRLVEDGELQRWEMPREIVSKAA